MSEESKRAEVYYVRGKQADWGLLRLRTVSVLRFTMSEESKRIEFTMSEKSKSAEVYYVCGKQADWGLLYLRKVSVLWFTMSEESKLSEVYYVWEK